MHTPYGYDLQGADPQESPYLAWPSSKRPAASQLTIEELDLLIFDERALRKYPNETCPICCCPFSLGDEANKLPCKHIFHNDCLVPWLKTNNTCPSCRSELATLDHDHEEKKRKPTNEDYEGDYHMGSSSGFSSIYS